MENRVLVFFTTCIFFFMPWYYMRSGLPQPVDIAIVLTLFLLLIMRLPALSLLFTSSLYRSFIYFFMYCIMVYLINFIANNSWETMNFIIQNVYYVLLITLFLMLFCQYQMVYGNQRTYQFLLKITLVSCLLPIGYWLGHPGTASRISLSFNNPNQLGFFALVNIAIVYYVGLLARQNEVRIKFTLPFIILNLNLLFLFLSASRACYPVLVLYILSYPLYIHVNFQSNAKWLYRIIGICLITLFIVLFASKFFQHMRDIRLSRLPTNLSGLSADFYTRALEGLTFESMKLSDFLIGNGTHTTSTRGYLEFHNNFIAIFNQVGALGLIFYLYLTVMVLKQLYARGLMYFMPFFCYIFYSSFQYSFRTRCNWLFIAIILFITLSSMLTQYHAKEKKISRGI